MFRNGDALKRNPVTCLLTSLIISRYLVIWDYNDNGHIHPVTLPCCIGKSRAMNKTGTAGPLGGPEAAPVSAAPNREKNPCMFSFTTYLNPEGNFN